MYKRQGQDGPDSGIEFGPQPDGTEVLPMIALRGMVVCPGEPVRLEVGREKSRAAVEAAFAAKQPVLLVAQRDDEVEEPLLKDMYMVGTIANIMSVVKLPRGVLSIGAVSYTHLLILKGLKFSLEQDGYETVSAADGEEALANFESEDFDLILLDVMLPRMSGIEVCQRIREKSTVPIIMLTAKGEDMDKILGLESVSYTHLAMLPGYTEL